MRHSRIHTLVVDDEQDVRDMLSIRLEMQGHLVAVAEDGSRALEMIQAQKFDLVLLDIMMPRLNGYEVLKQLKADILLRNIPVIVISAVDDIDSIVKCIEMGAEDYLLKPFNAVLLKARITGVLEKKWWRDQEFEYLEELLLMQRIDREMNISLDITRTLRIALECAIHHAGANAGLAGIVEEAGIRIVATQGYRTENAPHLGAYLPCELPTIREAIQSKQPRHLSAEEVSDSIGWVVTGPRLTIIPICRGANAVGLLLIEARAGNHIDDALSFLARLSDHAAIAISNAQLYAAVRAANNAKSEFVTLAAHELRAPMTSIKACTDLLAAGSVGPVNEAQIGFLSTIQSNVDRMMKLVTDLADISCIESGHLSIEFSAIPVIEIAQEVIRSTRGQIEEKGQTLALHIPNDLPAV
jgi:DNA-binding response OmpR family regulator